jgi:hypothetical protein
MQRPVEEHFFASALALQFGASGGGKTSTVRDISLQRGHCAVCSAKIYSDY